MRTGRIASLLLIALAGSATAAQYVQIIGTIEFSAYQGSNAVPLPQAHRIFEFQCVTGTNRWMIISKFIPNAIEHFSFDGTNVYRVVEDTAPSTNTTGKPPPSAKRLNSYKFLTISPGPLPLQNAGVNIPWLAFCSGDYLKTKDRLIPLPISETRHTSWAFGYDDETTVFDYALGLPKAVTLKESKKRFAESEKDERLFADPRNRRKNVSPVDGRIAFTYGVDRPTNFHGWTLPVVFRCDQYAYSLGGELDVHIVGSGKVSSISESGEPDINPFGKEEGYNVIDLRLSSKEQAARYRWTNATIPLMNERRN